MLDTGVAKCKSAYSDNGLGAQNEGSASYYWLIPSFVVGEVVAVSYIASGRHNGIIEEVPKPRAWGWQRALTTVCERPPAVQRISDSNGEKSQTP
jgi:nitrogen fixation protein FixH